MNTHKTVVNITRPLQFIIAVILEH